MHRSRRRGVWVICVSWHFFFATAFAQADNQESKDSGDKAERAGAVPDEDSSSGIESVIRSKQQLESATSAKAVTATSEEVQMLRNEIGELQDALLDT